MSSSDTLTKVLAGLVLLLALYSTDRWSARCESCVQPCRSLRDGSVAQTRCLRNACRDKVFRYYIRFGKRGDSSEPHPDLRRQRHSSDRPSSQQSELTHQSRLQNIAEMMRRYRREQRFYLNNKRQYLQLAAQGLSHPYKV